MKDKNYSINAEFDLEKFNFSEVLEKVKNAFMKHGFGIMTEIDAKSVLKEKLGKDFDDYVILGICNPSLAYGLLQKERDVGLVLPCNVIVYSDSEENKIKIKAMNPETALDIFNESSGAEEIEDIKCDAREKIVEAIKDLKGEADGK